jgi:hypothetical protein
MGERKRKVTEWVVIRLRARGEYLGRVSAPDEAAAMKGAIKMLRLDQAEAKRLLLRQCR